MVQKHVHTPTQDRLQDTTNANASGRAGALNASVVLEHPTPLLLTVTLWLFDLSNQIQYGAMQISSSLRSELLYKRSNQNQVDFGLAKFSIQVIRVKMHSVTSLCAPTNARPHLRPQQQQQPSSSSTSPPSPCCLQMGQYSTQLKSTPVAVAPTRRANVHTTWHLPPP